MLESQQIMYDCGVYKLPFPVDLPVTLLSGTSSILRTSVDITLPLQPLQDAGGFWSPSAPAVT